MRLCLILAALSVSSSASADEYSSRCEDNPQWTPVTCVTGEWVWSSDRSHPDVASADAARTLWAHYSDPYCSLDGTGWVSNDSFEITTCDTDWYHIGGRYTGNCAGHNGNFVQRLTMGDDTCFNVYDPDAPTDDGVGVALELGGECPGASEINITGNEGGRFVIVTGDSEGSTVIPGGRCAGTELGIEASIGGLDKFGPVPDLDGDGTVALTPTLPAPVCDQFFQVLDLTDCSVSDVESFDGDGPPGRFEFTGSQVIDGAEVTCSSVETTPEYTQCSDLQQGGLYFPNGITCGPEWSFTNSSYSDTDGFCASLTGSSVAEVYYTCAESITRATWFDGVWGTTVDNGYIQDVRCYYP